MNYEKASKFEVNAEVSKYVLWKNRQCEEINFNDKAGVVSWADGANWHEFNPHDNPSDAWLIIMENFISIDQHYNGSYIRVWGYCDAGLITMQCLRKDALRTAMVVFLKMMEANRG